MYIEIQIHRKVSPLLYVWIIFPFRWVKMLIFGKGFYIVFVGNSVSPRSNVAIVDHMSLILTDSNLELMACPPIFLDKALKLIPFPVSSWLTTLFSGFSASIDHISLTWLVDKTFKSWSNLTIFLLYFHIYFHMYMSPTFPYSSWFNLITCLLYFLYISPYVPMFPLFVVVETVPSAHRHSPRSGVLPVPWEKSEVKRHFSAVVETRAAVTAMRSGRHGILDRYLAIWLLIFYFHPHGE